MFSIKHVFCTVVVMYSTLNLQFIDAAEYELVPLMSKDLDFFLGKVRSITNFALKHKNDFTDVNVYFGITIMKIQLVAILNHDQSPLDPRRKLLIKEIVKDLHALIIERLTDLRLDAGNPTKFNKGALLQHDYLYHLTKEDNENNWLQSLPHLGYQRNSLFIYSSRVPKKKGQALISHLDHERAEYLRYITAVMQVDKGIPNPEVSDACLLNILNSSSNVRCNHDERNHCAYCVYRGTSYGYAMTHRLLILQIAALKGCAIKNRDEDARMIYKLCTRMLEEAIIIGKQDCSFLDLLAEQIALCALNGHSEYLCKNWFNRFENYETADHCYKPYSTEDKELEKVINKHRGDYHFDFYKGCSLHTTFAVGSAYAAALRYSAMRFRIWE